MVCKPKADFNACEDFLDIVVTGHILTAALKMLEMRDSEDIPKKFVANPEEIWMLPDEQRKQSLEEICQKFVENCVHFSYNNASVLSTKDEVFNYAREMLRLGCLYLEYCDAVREGDGERLFRCYRYLLPIFMASGSRNYSCEVFNMLYQLAYVLPPNIASELMWGRFINTHGCGGKNICIDLHMEHLNRIAKVGLGSNKTKAAIGQLHVRT